MRKEICLILVSLSLCLLITACGNPDREEHSSAPEEQTAITPEISVSETSDSVLPPAAELSRRKQDWIEDIEYLREQYTLLHADPFYFRPEEEFDRKLDELSERIEDLSDHDLFFELAAVMACGNRAPSGGRLRRGCPYPAQYIPADANGGLCIGRSYADVLGGLRPSVTNKRPWAYTQACLQLLYSNYR